MRLSANFTGELTGRRTDMVNMYKVESYNQEYSTQQDSHLKLTEVKLVPTDKHSREFSTIRQALHKC